MKRTQWRECPRGDVASRHAEIYVSLSPAGKLSINRIAYERMGEPQAVNLLFDAVNNRIGLKPTIRSGRNAYPVTRLTAKGRRAVYGHRLLVENGIDLSATVRFYDAEIDQDGILILDLRTARVRQALQTTTRGKELSLAEATGRLSTDLVIDFVQIHHV
jgi:hypothetical protein